MIQSVQNEMRFTDRRVWLSVLEYKRGTQREIWDF